MNVYQYITETINSRGGFFSVLIDPDKAEPDKLRTFVRTSKNLQVDALFVGSSLLLNDSFEDTVKLVKENAEIPVVLFPGSPKQISRHADAILFISLISGRNSDFLFGDHVVAAPVINKSRIEPIGTGYMLVESGSISTTEYVTGTQPIPRDKPDIAVAHALAAEYLGMKMVYLEAGSGAASTVPNKMIEAVRKKCTLPLIVGGGITEPDIAHEKIRAGAGIIVIGNVLENNWDEGLVRRFADNIHNNEITN